MSQPLNASLDDNQCFGCGLANADGLRVHIYRDGESQRRLVGTWEPRPLQIGFPEIVHGGLQFTALDCMAGWVTWALRAPPGSLPLTVQATMKYLLPATVGNIFSLAAEVVREPQGPRDPIGIRATLSDRQGRLLSEADFDYTTLPADKFLKVVGLAELPLHYRRWLTAHGD
jgi:acyl-coenzyme A thioesterase PaaI-like protein